MTDRVQGEPAPYALVRLAALPHPDGAAAAAPFRRAVEALADKESELLALAGPLSDLLHDSAGAHSAEFHRRVVLPLRRDVHNRRTPRPSVRAAAESLRIPLLDTWFRLMDECAELVLEVERHQPAALAAEREVLASLCAAEPLRKAAVLSGHDLWRGLGRTGSGDRRARKAEPAVLRYALRATSKTSPLSWYTSVGWGTWSPDAPAPDWGTPVAVTRVNQVLLTRLVAALVADRTRVFGHPHRLAPGVHEDGGRMTFLRDVPASGPLRAHVAAEENVELAVTAPLRFLVGLTAANPKGISPAELTSALATRLPDGESARAQRYIALLLDVKLLVPVLPVDPQDPEACRSLASWLRDTGRAALGDRVASIHRSTAAFGALPADSRPAAMAALTAAWQELGELTGAELTGIVPLSEDVVLPQPVRLGRAYGYDGVRSLAALTPLLMLFDRQLAIRRYLRDQFVVEFGRGGSARLAACAPLLLDALASAPTGGLGASRAQVADLVRDGVITDEAVEAAADLLPSWMKTRPVSYSFFAQPSPGGLVVNHVYDGFGRFPSRFLDLLPPEAYASVRATLDGVFPRGFAEYRPVQGFNPNLHPLLSRVEIGEDPHWADHTPDALELYHDQERDELRLRRRDSGAVVDVLYLGYLMPISLPGRAAALHADLACGAADLSALRSVADSGDVRFADRLRYRDVVLARRSWEFSAEALDFADIAAVTRFRARHGLPAQLFAGMGGVVSSREDYLARMNGPKPQYVDLTNALHLRCLPRLLSRYRNHRVQLTEALPVPSGQVVEVFAETYRRAE
ncbi:lantibiotic biosynthesis dehydratase-like protein [Lentzea atacamensis]|uniref:Lantibiotic biosynthesis dehydratase-like protein n=1 Tax=Lentzea atacamensis TaxID=531938 RepID=A0A316I4H5_9PSEU|nr:lantibiotic dehydratase [Lentzea atacamensis]PWK88361.1 lantibiotic biosynthesis dehydratase-like protein [Lentzea atacamensis]